MQLPKKSHIEHFYLDICIHVTCTYACPISTWILSEPPRIFTSSICTASKSSDRKFLAELPLRQFPGRVLISFMKREKDLTECMPTLKVSVTNLDPQTEKERHLTGNFRVCLSLILSDHLPKVFVSFPCLGKKKPYCIATEAYCMEKQIPVSGLVPHPETELLDCEVVRKESGGEDAHLKMRILRTN